MEQLSLNGKLGLSGFCTPCFPTDCAPPKQHFHNLRMLLETMLSVDLWLTKERRQVVSRNEFNSPHDTMSEQVSPRAHEATFEECTETSVDPTFSSWLLAEKNKRNCLLGVF